MPNFGRSLNESASKYILTDKSKEIVLERPNKKRHKRFEWKIAFISIAIVALVLAIILAFSETDNTTYFSSILAPRDADEAFMKRVKDFIAIVEDGVITDVDRRNYLAKSDWALQLALETGNSTFYNNPSNLSNEQVQQLNTLLAKMYAYISKEETVHQDMQELQRGSSFEDVIINVGKWNELLSTFIDVTYSSSTKEKPQFNNKFLVNPWIGEIIILIFFVVLVYLFIQNIRIGKKLYYFVFHVIVVALIGQYFLEKDPNQYGYDETSILQSMQMKAKETFRSVQVHELLAIAQFDDIRYGLAKLDDDSIMITEFVKQRSGYVMRNSSIAYSNTVNRNYSIGPRELAEVWGVRPESKIQQIVYTVEGANKVIELPINPNFADIYMIRKPNEATEGNGWSIDFRYEKGYEKGVE